MLRVIIVEDEKNSRATLKSLLGEFCEGVEVVGEAENVKTALEEIKTKQPDLVFLDIELHSGTGFEVLTQVEALNFEIIFTTAFEQYAIKAIKFSSLDYLLKPIDLEELQNAVAKAQLKKNENQRKTQLETLLSNLSQNSNENPRICLATSVGLEFLNTADIIYCEASGSYTNFYLKNDKKIIVSKHLKGYETLLGDNQFMRVHNKFLINLKEVQRFVKSEGGYILMKNDAHISISPKKRDLFFEKMMNLN